MKRLLTLILCFILYSLPSAHATESIGNTRQIAGVVANGKYLPRESLQKMLADAETLANKN